MFTPLTPSTKRARIRTEREYREWQWSLRGKTPVKRFRNEPGFLTRAANVIRRMTVRKLRPGAELRRMERTVSTSRVDSRP